MRMGRVQFGSESDARIAATVRIFISPRMEDREVFQWALNLRPYHRIERIAVQERLQHGVSSISPIWWEAWSILTESWGSGEPVEGHGVERIDIARRISAGDRSGDLVKRIVELSTPVMVARPGRSFTKQPNVTKRWKPRRASDVIEITITASHPIDPAEFGISEVSELGFLRELAEELDFSIKRTQSRVARIEGDGRGWRLGVPHRVSYVGANDRPADQHEPDEYSTGIAFAVKLLHFVVKRIAEIKWHAAKNFTDSWCSSGDALRVRLWASFALDSRFATAAKVAGMLKACSQELFWSLYSSPEICQLRAVRFSEMSLADRRSILVRIKRGPPQSFWGKPSSDEIRRAQRYRTLNEVRRIEVAGGVLPADFDLWYREAATEFPELSRMMAVDEDYWTFRRATWREETIDQKYDDLIGTKRLRALENALSGSETSWPNDPQWQAASWIRHKQNASLLLQDLESEPSLGDSFPEVWSRFGGFHSPRGGESGAPVIDVAEGLRVLKMITALSPKTRAIAIEGLTAWMDAWCTELNSQDLFRSAWLDIWPDAAKFTNDRLEDETDPLNTAVRGGDVDSPRDLDTLNTPSGKLVGVFLQCCPNLGSVPEPFENDSVLRSMRDACLSSGGRSELIARYRLFESVEYFLRADGGWTKDVLLPPLLEDTEESLILWRAMASRWRFDAVVQLIGDQMVLRVVEPRLGRRIRGTLAESVVLEALHAMNEGRSAHVSSTAVTQMLRAADEGVRATVAGMLSRFVREMSSSARVRTKRDKDSAEALFDNAVRPFLTNVWPQEATLSTPPVARAFASLPVACGNRLPAAVETVRRFLVPFDSWSLHEYGLLDRTPSHLAEVVTSVEKARALLELFDATISGVDGSPVPVDLGTALQAIDDRAPKLSLAPAFRRLAALARK